MSDIIREVDEELRHERYMKLWDRYGLYLVGAALIVVIGVGGWRGYEWYSAREAAKSGARFEAAMQLSADGKRAEAEAAFNELARDATFLVMSRTTPTRFRARPSRKRGGGRYSRARTFSSTSTAPVVAPWVNSARKSGGFRPPAPASAST
jgi:hypothetical protein